MSIFSKRLIWVILALFFIVTTLLIGVNANRFKDAARVVIDEIQTDTVVSDRRIPVLMYHHLVEDISKYEGNEAIVSVEQFRKQMEFLAEEGFTTLNSAQLLDFLSGSPVPDNTVVITFDDGYESNYIHAFPILKEFGLKAIIHVIIAVTPGEIGGDRGGIPKIDWDQMKRMVDSGVVDIQAHTFDSHYYAKINEDGATKPKLSSPIWIENEKRTETQQEYIARITEDLKLSENVIEERLSNDVIAIAYPFGVHNDIVRRIIRDETGMKLGFTVRHGYVSPEDDPLLLNRINVSPRWTLEDFIKTVRRQGN